MTEIHGIREVQRVASPEPHAFISTSANDLAPDEPSSLDRLAEFAQTGGDISHLLTDAELVELGVKAVREWRIDSGSRSDWLRRAERSLAIAAQEESEEDEREPLWDTGANIHSPLLTIGALAFAAKASPDLIRGDQVVGIKVFEPPEVQQPVPPPSPQPQNPAEAQQLQQAAQQQIQQAQAEQAQRQNAEAAKNARGVRVKLYMNYLIFYKMDGWEDETDQLLHETPVVGSGFKKVYMSAAGLRSDYVCATRLTVHKDTRSLYRCPRITEDFDIYPYEIEDRVRSGTYRRIDLPPAPGNDPQKPRLFLEQHRMEDLDHDGLEEPYIVTVDEETQQVLRVEAAYDDPMIRDGRVSRIERWLPYASYKFLPDMKGGFYGTGYGKLLEPITDSIDATINQLLDAGTAQIAGGGFIASGVRMQGSGQGGVVTFQPGEFPVVNADGATLKESVWERTIPNPSEVSFKLMELMMDWGKNIMSTQEVATGDGPTQAPVGTTFALQNQALMGYRACFKRMFRGFRDEFRLMYMTLKRFATDRERKEYQELTGGNFDQDFSGDGTDIQPIADPAVVTKMQKMARVQAIAQWAEGKIGQAAGMTQPEQAQKITKDFLEDMDVDNPDGYIGQVQPNPEVIAKAQDMQASAAKKQAEAQAIGPKLQIEAQKVQLDAADIAAQAKDRQADVGLIHAKTLREVGLAAKDTHELHKEADRIAQTGSVADNEQLMDPAEEAEKDRQAAASKPEGEAA